jgi:hypothetical protein
LGDARLRVAQFLANFWHGELVGQLTRQLAAARFTGITAELEMG